MIEIHKQVKAKKDLKGIWLYSYQQWGEKQADCYFDEINQGIDLIASHPGIGIPCDEIKKDYRCFKIKEHEVFYKTTKTRIVIIRVLHKRMNPFNQL